MSEISTLRANVKAAVVSLVPVGTEVLEARIPEMSFALAVRPPTVVISYTGKPKKREGTLGTRGNQGYTHAFTIAVIELGFEQPAAAVDRAEDIAELIFGSSALPPATPNLHTIVLGTISGQSVYLKCLGDAKQVDPGSTAQGGKYGVFQQWETDPEVRRTT